MPSKALKLVEEGKSYIEAAAESFRLAAQDLPDHRGKMAVLEAETQAVGDIAQRVLDSLAYDGKRVVKSR